MKPKSMLLLVFAVGCGLVAMLGVQQAMSKKDGQQVNKTKVLTAVTDIGAGVRLSETNVEFREWPTANVPEGAVTSIEAYEERALVIPATAGDFILESKLGEKGEFGAAVSIPKGMRVKTIAVTDTTTHSGMLMPADRVDILVTFKARSERDGMVTVTKTLIENVEVFAADNRRSMKNDDTQDAKSKTISMLVTPEQAEVLTLAGSKGSLDLVLRPKGDHEVVHPDGIDENLLVELKGGSSQASTADVGSENEDESDEDAGGNIQAFLQGAEAPATANNTQPEAVEADTETWTVKIYAAEEVVEQEFDLISESTGNEAASFQPVTGFETTAATVDATPEAQTTTTNAKATSGSWLEALLGNGGKQEQEDIPVPTKEQAKTAVEEIDSIIGDDLSLAIPLQ